MRNKLLLALDQFEPGQAAVAFTIGLAARLKSDVYVLHVREVPSSLGIAPLESAAEAQGLVADAVPTVADGWRRRRGRSLFGTCLLHRSTHRGGGVKATLQCDYPGIASPEGPPVGDGA
jgi:hypothetical protein